ncbi:glycosyltransferase [Oleomonas cavernae]|uniref:Glycosyltransferase n=1 Tax=Oleomonas cavernae TaxID=2320859 RepID=A0A418WG74_9PROT|nr:glycosyltransferase family 4 protein [Oleomonas cavernae]RJF89007.1 glycosyltransferase [Oleomonas cavernae]
MSAPRCLIVTPYAVGGGVTEAFFTSIEIMRRAGAVPIAMVDAKASFLERLAAAGIETVTVPGLGAGGSLNAWAAGRRAGASARRLAPAVILAHNGRYIDALKRRVGSIPVVGVVHGGKLDRFLGADRLITVNQEQAVGLVAKGYAESRLAVIPNVLPVDAIPPFTTRPWAQPPAIGTLRLLVKAKGVDILIAAVGLLARRGLTVGLHIGGTGEEEAALRRQVAQLALDTQVTFHGWVSDQAAFLGAMDLYVMPSRFETFGIGILEAQAAGLPVIASNCEGPASVLRDGDTGLLVPPGEPAALADSIARLISDRAFAESLARNGHADCAARHLLPAIAGRYGDFVFGRNGLSIEGC